MRHCGMRSAIDFRPFVMNALQTIGQMACCILHNHDRINCAGYGFAGVGGLDEWT